MVWVNTSFCRILSVLWGFLLAMVVAVPNATCSWGFFVRFGDLELSDSIVGQRRKGLELFYKWCISIITIRWKLQLIGFSYDKKNANVVMWKDKEYEYISSAWNKQQWGTHHSLLAKCQPKGMFGVGASPLISIIYDWTHYDNNNNNKNKIYVGSFPFSPMAPYNKKKIEK